MYLKGWNKTNHVHRYLIKLINAMFAFLVFAEKSAHKYQNLYKIKLNNLDWVINNFEFLEFT